MRLIEITLPADNIFAQREFYTKTLCLEGIEHTADSFAVRIGWSRLRFVATTDFPGPAHFAFNVAPEHWPRVRDTIASKTPLVVDDSGRLEFRFESWNADAFYFRDPDGNLLEGIARHDLSGDIGPADSGDFLCVSEIGVVADDIRGEVRRLVARHDCDVYSGADSDSFTAVGDVFGLFIVVRTGRP